MLRTKIVAGALAFGLVAFAGSAGAHNFEVNNPGNGTPQNTDWVGGPPGAAPLPASAQGQGLFPHPAGLQAAAHGKGLVQACEMTLGNPSAASFPAPPPNLGTFCRHGAD